MNAFKTLLIAVLITPFTVKAGSESGNNGGAVVIDQNGKATLLDLHESDYKISDYMMREFRTDVFDSSTMANLEKVLDNYRSMYKEKPEFFRLLKSKAIEFAEKINRLNRFLDEKSLSRPYQRMFNYLTRDASIPWAQLPSSAKIVQLDRPGLLSAADLESLNRIAGFGRKLTEEDLNEIGLPFTPNFDGIQKLSSNSTNHGKVAYLVHVALAYGVYVEESNETKAVFPGTRLKPTAHPRVVLEVTAAIVSGQPVFLNMLETRPVLTRP